MTSAEAFLLRRPVLSHDSVFRGYRFRSSAKGATQPYRQLLAACAAGRRAHGLCVIDDAGPPMDELLPECPPGTVLALDADRAAAASLCKQRGLVVCARLDGSSDHAPAGFANADYVWWENRPTQSPKPLAKLSQRLPGKRIAGGISDREQFLDAKELGAILFEGNWYERVQGNAKSVAPAQANVLELIGLVRAEAPVAQIEQLLKRDASLSFRLLRYVNAAGLGLSCEIQSFRHAVSILGYQNLSRWLALLLATSGATAAAPVLMREAATRGRMMELLGEAYGQAEDRDNLFIVGVFSLLPPILQLPMDQLVEQLSLPDAINDALLRREGLYGPLLAIAEGVENTDGTALTAAAGNLHLSAAQINRFHLEAIAWAEELTAG